jgi:hypothetical protein
MDGGTDRCEAHSALTLGMTLLDIPIVSRIGRDFSTYKSYRPIPVLAAVLADLVVGFCITGQVQ